jgi:SAM-dependent methyltransferase
VDRELLREELRVLENANRNLGGCDLVLHYVQRLVGARSAGPLSILDLATGGGDIPRAIVDWARRCGIPIAITAVDRHPDVLELAREACGAWPEIRLEQQDLLNLSFRPGSFDLVLCSLALHHFAAGDAIIVLRRMQELARAGYIVNDLRRNWLAIGTTELVSRTLVRSPIVRHDAPQSCRSAFTVRELHALAQRAGLRRYVIRRHHAVFRMVLLGWK